MFIGLMFYQYQYMYENDNISNDNQKIFTPKNETKKNSELNYQKAESMYYNLLSTFMNHYTSWKQVSCSLSNKARDQIILHKSSVSDTVQIYLSYIN